MLKSFKASSNIIKFDDSQSQQSQKDPNQTNPHFEKLNPQINKQNHHVQINKLNHHQIQTFKTSSENRQQSFSRYASNEKSKYHSLRRNKSFKVNKQYTNPNKSRNLMNKSVTKYKNVFEEAQDVDLKSQNSEKKFAIHNQTNIEQRPNANNIFKQTLHNSFQTQLSKAHQCPPILKISNLKQKNFMDKQPALTNSVKFSIESTVSSSIMAKTTYIQRQNQIKQTLQRKLSYRPQSRKNNKQTNKQPNKQQKIKVKIQNNINFPQFTHKKIQKTQVLVAKLKKDTSGFNFLWPEFHMHDQKTNIHILSAKKKAANTTSNYYISRNSKQIDVQNDDYMGKVRSNFLGSCYNIFNQGSNPQATNKKQNNVRQLLATVIYESQITSSNPKSMKIYMIKYPYIYYDLQGTNPKEQQTNLQDLYEIGHNKSKIYLFKNRRPTYNKKQNKFVLNFDGRIKRPSTKNFILQDSQTKRQVLMFGKTNDYPLTPHIGLGIALAQLDGKIICD